MEVGRTGGMQGRGRWRAFPAAFAVAAAATLAALAAVTVTVDPLWVFRDEPPWLAWTGGANRHLDLAMRRAKPLQLFARPAGTVFVGSSVVYRGLDPADIAGGGYNLGLSSLMADELPLVARLVGERDGVQRVVLGLDYYMFTALPGPPRLDPDLARGTGRLRAWLAAAVSLRSLTGAVPSAIRNAPEPGRWHRDGYKETPDYPPAVTRRLSAEQDFAAMAYRPASIAHLEAAFRLLRGTGLTAYLSPISEAQLRLARGAGRESEIERWRVEAAEAAARADVTLYDLSRGHPFDDFDPARGSSARWLDSLHFKPEVGRWVLDRLGVPAARGGL